jgi:alkanesulfonate monooxygenase SsuD/methylene tetrahydromethanopterin reductase-like flavin-dependent oxidoreductase (luciferase family)
MIGGSGEQKTLRLVARYADACNLFGAPPADIAHKLDVLRRHCETEGSDYERIAKTVLAQRSPVADVDAFLDDVRAYGELGVTEVMVMPDRHPVEFATELADRVLPRLADLG